MSNPSHRSQSEAFAQGLELGVVEVASVVSWAVARIEAEDAPHWSRTGPGTSST